jgi:dolichyl-phosphate beta-glucosyltransferase
LFSRQTIDGFAFDVEILFLARKKGLKLKEVGVDWYYRERSKVRIIRDSFAMTVDLLKLRWRYHRGRYHQSPGKDTTAPGPG